MKLRTIEINIINKRKIDYENATLNIVIYATVLF